MRERFQIFLVFIFFLSAFLPPALSTSDKVSEVSNEGELITPLGEVSYGGQEYKLYRMGDIYVVLDPSSRFVRDQTTIQRIILTKEVSSKGKGYSSVYEDVHGDLEDLESAMKDIRSALVVGGAIAAFSVFTSGTLLTVAVGGSAIPLSKTEVLSFVAGIMGTEIDYSREREAARSLSELASGFGSTPAYEDVDTISRKNRELLANMSEIRGVIALEKGNNTFTYVSDVLIELGNRFKGIPLIGNKLGGPLVEKGEKYRSTIAGFDSDLVEVEAISEEITILSEKAVGQAPESLRRITSKEGEADSKYGEASSSFLDLKGYVSDLSLRRIPVESQVTLVGTLEERLHELQESIDAEEYNSAIEGVEELEVQVDEARRASEEIEGSARSAAGMRIEELEDRLFHVQEKADSAVEAGAELPNLDYQMTAARSALDTSKAKFREGYFVDAEELAVDAMETLEEVESAVDSALSEMEEQAAVTPPPPEEEEAGMMTKLYLFFKGIKDRLLSIF